MTLPHRHTSPPAPLPHAAADQTAADRRLLARALAGDESAFESVVRAHYPGLCDHVLRYVGCPEIAEDLVLELFAHLWDRRHRSIPLTVDRGYLYRSARNRALDHLRRQRVATGWIERMSREVQDPPDDAPDDALECRELAAAAARAVAELPEQRRRIFVLCREHDMSYAEVGERLGISPRTVNTQMTRALKSLRAKLAPYFPCT